MDEHGDPNDAEAFEGRILAIINDASLAFMISIGHQTRLFDVMASLAPSTSQQIATAATLNERYVREWLGAMVAGRIVSYEPSSRTYLLPPPHAAFLARAAGLGNLAPTTQYFAQFGAVEQELVACFREGGGVPYSAYARFQEIEREQTALRFDAALISVTLPFVAGLVDLLNAGIELADVGCGSGHAVNVMAKAFPKSRFVGYDISEQGIALASREAAAMGLVNARFELKDVATLDGANQFDAITAFDSIHDQVQPAQVLKGIYEALLPGAPFLCVDVAASSDVSENRDHPLGPFIYTASTMHCLTVSLAYGGAGLGAAWGEQLALQMLADAGFRSVEVKTLEGDRVNNYYVARK